MSTAKTFSESWYRIAAQRISLRPQVEVRRHYFRGERWYVLRDPFNNQFFRLRPPAYAFVARLRRDRTVEEAWKECLELDPDGAPGQEDVIQLLAQMYHANLLQYDLPEDSVRLFDRYRKRRQKEIQSRLLSIMFARFPLIDPDDFLRRTLPVVGKFISPLGAAIWIAAVAGAVKVVVDNFGVLVNQSQAVLAPANLPLLYLALVIIKVMHEFGHAYICRHLGGEVHTMGVMLLVFTPLPYMDATSAWTLRSRWKRALVGGAGMIVEVFVAAIAAFVWAGTAPGTLHSLAYNMMFIASVSTILFNGNPLLRFDGYYILSDLLDIPNLHQRASQHMRHLLERYAFGYRKSESPTRSRREAALLVVFGVLSGIYRVVVFTGILLFVADRFLLAGIIMAAICAVSWVIVPTGRFIHYLASNPRLERSRPRAMAVSAGFAALLVAFLHMIPFPSAFKAPGIVEAVGYTEVVNETPGYIREILTPAGRDVRPGRPLIRLEDPDLDHEIALARSKIDEAEALRRRAMTRATADLASVNAYIEAAGKRLSRLEERREALVVRARRPGTWVAPEIDSLVGAWVPRKARLGEIVNADEFRFSAIVAQRDAARLFAGGQPTAQVRVRGQAGTNVPVISQRVIPMEQQILPSAALAWQAGGEVAVRMTESGGLQAAEPFFQVIAGLEPVPGVGLLHGRSGRIRFVTEPEPLLRQWSRTLWQLLQRRYGL